MRIHKNNFKNYKKPKRIVRGITLSLCIFAGLSVTTDGISQANYNYSIVERIDNDPDSLLNELEDYAGIETNDNNNLVVLHAIIDNNKLESEEKAYFYQLVDLISENPYLNKRMSYETLSDLDIVYTGKPNGYDETILALYSEEDNIIKVFAKKEELNKEIFYHELIHALFTNKETINLPKFILEGETELLTNEYLSDNPFLEKNTYPFEVSMIKLLCEMVGEDEILKVYTTGNINSLYEKLNENSDLDSKQFIDNVDKVFRAFSEKKSISAENFTEMITYLDNYFYSNYQTNTEKQEIYEYYKGILNKMYLDNPYSEYENYIYEKGIILKPYYSKKLKELYPLSEKALIEEPSVNTYKKTL